MTGHYTPAVIHSHETSPGTEYGRTKLTQCGVHAQMGVCLYVCHPHGCNLFLTVSNGSKPSPGTLATRTSPVADMPQGKTEMVLARPGVSPSMVCSRHSPHCRSSRRHFQWAASFRRNALCNACGATPAAAFPCVVQRAFYPLSAPRSIAFSACGRSHDGCITFVLHAMHLNIIVGFFISLLSCFSWTTSFISVFCTMVLSIGGQCALTGCALGHGGNHSATARG